MIAKIVMRWRQAPDGRQYVLLRCWLNVNIKFHFNSIDISPMCRSFMPKLIKHPMSRINRTTERGKNRNCSQWEKHFIGPKCAEHIQSIHFIYTVHSVLHTPKKRLQKHSHVQCSSNVEEKRVNLKCTKQPKSLGVKFQNLIK